MSSLSRSRSKPRVVKHSSPTPPTDPLPDHVSSPSPSSLLSPSLPIIRYSRDELLAFSTCPLAPSLSLPPTDYFQLRSKDQTQSSTGRKGRSNSNTPKPDSMDHSNNNSNLSRRTRNRSSSPKGNKSHLSTKSSSGSSNSNSESWHQWQTSGNDRESSHRDRLGHRDFSSLGERRRNQDGHLTLERYSEWEIEQDKKNDETFGDSAGLGDFFDFAPRDFDPIASYKAERRAREGKRHLNFAPVDAIAQFRKMMKSSKTDDIESLTDTIDQTLITDIGDDASINAMNDETFGNEADGTIPDEDNFNTQSGPQGRFGRLFVDEPPSVTSPTDDSVKPESLSINNTPVPEEPTNTGSEQRQFQFLMRKIASEKSNKPNELSPVDTRSQGSSIAPNDPRLATSPPEPPSPPLTSQIPQPIDVLSQHQANLYRQQQIMYQQVQQLANVNDSRGRVGAATPQYDIPEAVMQTQRRQHQFMLHHQQQQLGTVNHGVYPQSPGPMPPSSSPYPSNMVNGPSEQEYLEALARERAVKKKAAALIAATSQMPTSVRRQQAAQNLPRPPLTNQMGAGYPMGVAQGIQHHPHALAQQQAARIAAQAAMFEQLRARAAPPHMFPGSHVHPPGGMMSPPYGPPHGSGPNMAGIRPRAPLPPHAAEAQSALYSFLQQHQNGSNPVNTNSPSTTGSPPHTTSRQVNVSSTSPVSGTPPPRPPMMGGPMYGGPLTPGVPNPNMYGMHPPPVPPPGIYGPPGTTYGGPPRPYAPSPPHLLGGTPPQPGPVVPPQLSQHVMTGPGHLAHHPPPGMVPGGRRET